MTPRFAIVGHPNKGKSSIVATLAEDEAVAISPRPGTTTRATPYPMQLDGQTLYELIDTPGFQRAREVLDWLEAHDRGAGTRADTVAEFLRAHANDPRFHDEREILAPIMEGAGILYVVDGSRPYSRPYEAEMEILRRTGQPRMALINLIGPGHHLAEWQAALSQYFSIVRVFDAMHADFAKRIELLRAFGAIDERWTTALNQAADALLIERERRKQRAASVIAEFLIKALSATAHAPLPEISAQNEVAERVRAELRDTLRRLEGDARKAVQQIYRHADTQTQEAAHGLLAEDIFSQRSFRVFGLSTRQLAITGAATGAAAGSFIDAVTGGASLLLGAGVGAALGAAGAVAGAGRLARLQVLGQPLGGYELVAGPVTDPNLPWVLLARALLHLRLVAERNHARRDLLTLEAASPGQEDRGLTTGSRRRLAALFEKIRKQRIEDARLREMLAEAIAAQIETP
jgi:hypothetical protein